MRRIRVLMFVAVVTALIAINSTCWKGTAEETLKSRLNSHCFIPHPMERSRTDQEPTVFVASLPCSGAELVGELFHNSSDFLYLTTNDVTIPVPGNDVTKLQACYWPVHGEKVHTETSKWFMSMFDERQSFLENLPHTNENVRYTRWRFRELKESPSFVLNLLSGFWNTKLTWIHSLEPNKARFILVLRDPRDWVYALTREDISKGEKAEQRLQIEKILNAEQTKCEGREMMPWENQQNKHLMKGSIVERLANQWAANVATMLRTARSVQIVRFEDLVSDPEFASKEIMKRLGTTVSLPQMNRLTRFVRSGFYKLNFEPPLHKDSLSEWKRKMPAEDVHVVERICGSVMKKLMYL